ncbi:hypothetical protein [Fibrobacter sp.]|uniref:hypothetical protein n=1 Tax=Fibrobacter sp. TaxID=35828 RepID=UPI00388CF99F
MKLYDLIILPFALACGGLAACSTDPEPEDFSAEELRDMTPIMQFKGNPIPEDCYSEEHVTTDVTKIREPGDTYSGPFWRLECYFYYEKYDEFYQAIEDMGWKYDSDEGNQGDCGPKHEYTKTVSHRKLHLYVKTCDGSDWFVSKDRFLFHVEYN